MQYNALGGPYTTTRILGADFICNIMPWGDLIPTTRILRADFICDIMPWVDVIPTTRTLRADLYAI
jgi:hypothetical protein